MIASTGIATGAAAVLGAGIRVSAPVWMIDQITGLSDTIGNELYSFVINHNDNRHQVVGGELYVLQDNGAWVSVQQPMHYQGALLDIYNMPEEGIVHHADASQTDQFNTVKSFHDNTVHDRVTLENGLEVDRYTLKDGSWGICSIRQRSNRL